VRGRGCVGHGVPRGVGEQDLGEPGRAQLHEGVEEEREGVRRVEQVGAHHEVEGARGAHALQVGRVAPQQLRRHLIGQRGAVKGGVQSAALAAARLEQPGRWRGARWAGLALGVPRRPRSHQGGGPWVGAE
jgi:hypothetical protein